MLKTHVGSFSLETGGTYELRVQNVGGGALTGIITVTDPLPAGLRLRSITGANWSCGTSTATQVTCSYSYGLPPYSECPILVLAVTIEPVVPLPITNTASATGTVDGKPASASGTDIVERLGRVAPAPALTSRALALAVGVLLIIAARRLRPRARRGRA
jgi:uncharacterized repeat protein (TIGR01451 family)